jgi:hypothetical protein
MINMVKEYTGDRGFTARIGYSETVDYLELAYLQALSIKTTQKNYNQYAVLVDEKTNQKITDKHLSVFDCVVVVPGDWSFAKEWEVRNYSPWKRTIKVDVDLLFVSDITSWWHSFEQWKKQVVLTSTVETYRNEVIVGRWHRQLFDENLLPDIYTALYYFKDGVDSAEFFSLCESISNNWQWFAEEFLIKNSNPAPRDDEIFAIAAEIYGTERCTVPGAAYPRFVHFKEPLNEMPASKPWHDQIPVEFNPELWIGHYPQRLPLHYCSKSFAKKETIEHYEQNYRKLLNSN